jgi:hypothetical protein
MHNKSAMGWLAHDRQPDPVIPSIMSQEDVYYRAGDLIFFITRMLDSKALFVCVNNWLFADQRNFSERRRHVERRKREAIYLRPGIERRRWR